MTAILEQRTTETVTWTVTLRRLDGSALEYTGAESIEARVWSGDSTASLFSPTVAWLTAPNTVSLTITAAQLAGLEGDYPVLIREVSGADLAALTLRAVPGPGSATALPVYCTYNDLLIYAPAVAAWKTDSDRSQFAEQRNLARKWLDSIIVARYPRFTGPRLIGTQYFEEGYTDDQWLRDALDEDALIVRPWVVEATTRKSIHLIASRVGSRISQEQAREVASWGRAAAALVASSIAELDFDADGLADQRVNLGLMEVTAS